MKYKNPVIKGFYPDPSVCYADGKYYLVTSSFHYFQGVPLFESDDLVNWKQIGHVLTRKSQLPLEYAHTSGGIFAPTIRYNDGVFYMVTTNTSTARNFYVTTRDIYGEWSEPIFVEQDGIDPSLYFENGHAYFMSNGTDDSGKSGIVQCEIDINTGKKLSESRILWSGSGGRYLESPHLYKVGDYYYLTAAEGGTEYGHMITYARSKNIRGDYEGYKNNPVLTNRNLGGYVIQAVGHGDLIQKQSTGEWFFVHLGFRQTDKWQPFHHLGRETFLTPVKFNSDGWFTAGENGTTVEEFEIQGDFIQTEKKNYNFSDKNEWIYLRNPDFSKYETDDRKFVLYGTENSLDSRNPTFIGIRQKDFECRISCNISVSGKDSESGITVYMDENHHYDLAVKEQNGKYQAVLRLNIGDAKYVRNCAEISGNSALLEISSDNFRYYFKVKDGENIYDFGSAQTRYVSSEVACGFTGVIFGLYAYGNNCKAEFTDFSNIYK